MFRLARLPYTMPFVFAGMKVGVTLASLGLGWAGEDSVYQLILDLLGPLINAKSAVYLHPASFAVAFLIISFAHVVIGEVVPKNLALEKADRAGRSNV